jgi:uncharacterized Zn-binding protein involved in type VI secretion
MHTCPEHEGGPVLPPCAPTVLIGGPPAARIGDLAFCPEAPPDAIVKGAFPVPICGSPAARMTDKTAHGGSITAGCPTVLIGLAGTAGNVRVGGLMCQAAAKGRTSGSTQQSYNNCGVESSRQIINQANNSNITEDDLLQWALDNRQAERGDPPVPVGTPPRLKDGGTYPKQRQAILAHGGVSSTIEAGNLDNLGQALSSGKGVMTDLNPGILWNDTNYIHDWHVVLVTGIEYDDNGNITHVIINDTGTGACSESIPVDTLNNAINNGEGSTLNVTNNPIF